MSECLQSQISEKMYQLHQKQEEINNLKADNALYLDLLACVVEDETHFETEWNYRVRKILEAQK